MHNKQHLGRLYIEVELKLVTGSRREHKTRADKDATRRDETRRDDVTGRRRNVAYNNRHNHSARVTISVHRTTV